MFYAKWAKEAEMKKNLIEINPQEEVKKSGTPIMYNGNNLYVTKGEAHTLVIGASGSGKTQSIILPETKLSLLAEESVIINDIKGEIYKQTAYNFKENGYKVIVINFDKPTLGDNWNPLDLAYKLYKNNEYDKAVIAIEDIAYYLFTDYNNKETDSFWTNSTIDYFTGLTLYLFENNNKEVITLSTIHELANELTKEEKAKELLNKLDKKSTIYYNLAGTLTAPVETKGGIISTFNQKLKKYVSLHNLSKLLSKSDFKIEEIVNQKIALFIINGLSSTGNYLIPLLVDQLITATDEFGIKENKTNIILDEFDSMLPINNFAKLINYARGIKIKFTVVIKSYLDLTNAYGKEYSELIKSCFPNIIYLLTTDIYTLNEISKLCGNTDNLGKITPLITPEELKTLKTFEAIVLIPRMMPYKTTLLPDYKIEWNISKTLTNIEQEYQEK